MMVRVKICGITSEEDAVFSEKEGADAIGVILFSDSPRSVSLEKAKSIFNAMGPYCARVVVTHTESEDRLAEIAALSPSALQITAPLLRPCGYNGAMIRVITPKDPLPKDCDAIAIDGSRGRGIPYDRIYTGNVISASKCPVIICGGLTALNVKETIETFHPYAVDACSWMEDSPGIKNKRRISAFLGACGRRNPERNETTSPTDRGENRRQNQSHPEKA